MLERWFGVKIHHHLHVLGMMVLAFGLPMNKVLMSIGAIWGASNLILEGKFSDYWKNIQQNRTFQFLFGFFLLHVVAMAWSSNWEYGLHDLRIKLPLLAVPLALVAHPITKKTEIHIILTTFLISLLICTGYNFNYFLHFISQNSPEKFREMSLFGSHIRFGILVAIGSFLGCYFAWHYRKWLIPFLLVAIWFLIYTFFSQVVSGLISILAGLIFGGIYYLWQRKWLRFTIISSGFLLFILAILFLQSIKNPKDLSGIKVEHWTAKGHYYYNDLENPVFENGKPIYLHISPEELIEEWPNYFDIPYEGKDKKGHSIRETFYRYMTAKDLKKDAEGLNQLTAVDIQNIENGLVSPELLEKGIFSRINTIRYQLENSSNPNGQSLLQRIEYWKTAIRIIQENPILGVGTGDVQDAFNEQYTKHKTKLQPEYWFRAHNMFLTVQLSFGILGSLLFLSFLYSFLKINFHSRQLIAFCIFGAIFASFFMEDTLETQTGVSLFAFFLGLYLVPNDALSKTK
jgi:O-antigen ligase